MPRRWLALLVALATLAPACGLVGGDDAAGPSAPLTLPAETAVLRIASIPWPDCLNPLTCTDPAAEQLVWEHVLPKLMAVGADGTYVPSPVLAGMPDVSVDPATGQQTIHFVLDDEARWHDGRPITSSDVTGTWLARRSTPGALTPGHQLITAVDDRDPLVARVTLSQPYADWPELFGGHHGWLLQADAFDGAIDLTGRFEDGLGFGAGPFELASVDDRVIVLTARDRHWADDQQAAVDTVRIERVPADVDDLGSAVSGGIDLVVPGRPVRGATDRFEPVSRPVASVVGLFLDRRSPPLGSAAVRRAIALAVDRRQLVDLLPGGGGGLVECVGLVPQSPACEEQLPGSSGAAAEVEALLDADGWIRDPSGARGRPGLPLLLPVSYDPSLPGAEAVARAVRDALVPLGFGIVLQPTDPATWRQGDRVGSTGIGVFAAPLATAAQVASLYRCEAGDVNPLAWCEPANQLLARQLVATPVLPERADVAASLSDLAADALAWLPVRQGADSLLVDPDRVEAPGRVPIGSGPLGGLHAFARVEG